MVGADVLKLTAFYKPEDLLENPESSEDYNVAGNGERESSKTIEIGQSAADPLNLNDMRQVQRLAVGSKQSRSLRRARKLKSACDRGRWARRYDRCGSCGTVEIPHEALGLCERCYNIKRKREWTKKNPTWNKEYHQKMRKDPERYEKRLQMSRNWKDRNKERNRQYAIDYYHNNRDSELLKKNEKNHGGYYLLVLERDNFICQRCGKYPVFLVHHKDPKTRNHDPEFQITLCPSCDTMIHRTINLDIQDRIDFFV